METALIILNYNTAEKTIEMVQSAIDNNINKKFIIVVDNHSDNAQDKKLLEDYCLGNIKLISTPKNLGYGGALNYAAKNLNTSFLCFCNSDMLFLENPFPELEKFYKESPNRGCVGIQQIFPDLSFQRSYGGFLSFKEILSKIFYLNVLTPKKISNIKKVEYVDGAFMFISSKKFKEIKGFDKKFFFYFEDMDLCKRLVDVGYLNFIYPNKKIIHERGFSTNKGGSTVSKFSIKNFSSGMIKFIKTHFKNDMRSKLYIKLLKLQCFKQIMVYSAIRTKNSKFVIKKHQEILNSIDLP